MIVLGKNNHMMTLEYTKVMTDNWLSGLVYVIEISESVVRLFVRTQSIKQQRHLSSRAD